MKHKHINLLLSMLLVIAVLCGVLAVPSSAASLKGSRTVTIKSLGRKEYLSKSTGGTLGGNSWGYTSNDGLTGTAYCVNWGLNAVSSSKALPLEEYSRNPQTMGVFASGYPMRTLEQFKELHSGDVRGLDGLTEDEYKSPPRWRSGPPAGSSPSSAPLSPPAGPPWCSLPPTRRRSGFTIPLSPC